MLYKSSQKSKIIIELEVVLNECRYKLLYSETLNNEYIERIHQMSYSLLSD